MRHIITPAVAVVISLHAFASSVRADPRGEAEAAKTRLHFAESRLERASHEVADAQRVYDDRARRHAAAIAALQSAVADRDNIAREITIVDEALPSIARSLEDARRAADGYARSIPEAERRANETAAALEAIRAEALAAFEAGPAWTTLIEAIDAAQERYDAAVYARLDALIDDDVYVARLIDAMDAQAEVEAERARVPQDPQRLAAASRASMEALYDVSRMESDALARDGEVVAAQSAIRDAHAAAEQARREFEIALGNDPGFREAAQAHAAAREALDIAVNGARAADAEANRLHNELQRLEQQSLACRDRFARFDQDLRQYQFTIDQAGRDLQDASFDVTRARENIEVAVRERDDAAGRLRQVIERATEEDARHAREHEREHRAREHAENDRAREEAHRRELADASRAPQAHEHDAAARRASDEQSSDAAGRAAEEQRQPDANRQRQGAVMREQTPEERLRAREEAARTATRRQEAERARRERDQSEAKAREDSENRSKSREESERQAKAQEEASRRERENARQDAADRHGERSKQQAERNREEARREESSRREEPKREESRREPTKREEPRREEPKREEPKREEPKREEPRRDNNNSSDRGQRYKR